jgi:hypothetical protein
MESSSITGFGFSLVLSSVEGMGFVASRGLSVTSAAGVGEALSAPGEGVRGGSVSKGFGELACC